jgi:hypothetical protein
VFANLILNWRYQGNALTERFEWIYVFGKWWYRAAHTIDSRPFQLSEITAARKQQPDQS